MTCKHKNIKTLHEETGNRICMACMRHWYMGNQYTRKQWDDLMQMAVKSIEQSMEQSEVCAESN